jgi:hypothetical protein
MHEAAGGTHSGHADDFSKYYDLLPTFSFKFYLKEFSPFKGIGTAHGAPACGYVENRGQRASAVIHYGLSRGVFTDTFGDDSDWVEIGGTFD